MNCNEISTFNYLAGEICYIIDEECGQGSAEFSSPQDVFDTAINYAEEEYYIAIQNY